MENLGYLLYLLACPVGMGLMMWMMMRGNKGHADGSHEMPSEDTAANRVPGTMSLDDRLARLRALLDESEAQQAAIAAEISRLSNQDARAEPDGTTWTDPVEPTPLPARRRA